MSQTAVTVIVPVYNALDETQRCIASVFRHADTTAVDAQLLVIDDASPDPAIGAFLDDLRSPTPAIDLTILRNKENLGFVRTCNKGMRQAEGDVVLLNSDTVVTAGWLDRLHDAAREPDVATVTPLSSFGSICTMPQPVIDAFELAGEEPRIDECADFVVRNSVRRRPEVITGVGFCMYISRAALDGVGLFDEETFGAGYGEEVDFCLRASSLGFRHVVEDSTFVLHQGAGSFSERRQEGLLRGRQLIHAMYPYFPSMNAAERADEPLRLSFAALELGLSERREERPHVLQLLHSKPGELGGTEKHFWSLMGSLGPEFDVSVLQPLLDGYLLTTRWDVGRGLPLEQEFLLPGRRARPSAIDEPGAAAALETALDLFDFDAVHIQNIFHHSLAPLAVLADFDGPVSVSIRDQYLGCPHHWLLYRNERSCGIPEDLSLCARCLPETRGLDVDHLREFRRTVAERLDTVDNWVFASQSAADFFLRVYDVDPSRMQIIEHGAIVEHDRAIRVVDESLIFDEPLRVAYVGIGWSKKGLPTLNRLADELTATTIEFHHFGELREPLADGIQAHGHYDNNALPEMLARAGIHLVLLPGAIVESFGHVLTEAMIAARPVIASRWGALGERIRRHRAGWTIDPEDFDSIKQLITDLDRSRWELLRATERAVDAEMRSVGATADAYANLYRLTTARADTEAGEDLEDMQEAERLRRELRALSATNRQLQVQLTETKQKLSDVRQRAGPSDGPTPLGALRSRLWLPLRRYRAQWVRIRSALATRGPKDTAVEGVRRVRRRVRRRWGI